MNEQKWALVTGAAQRLGKSIAQELAQAGWNIALHYNRSASQAEQAKQAILATGVQCQSFAADLSDSAQVQRLFVQVSQLGPVRCVVNNASLFEFDAATDVAAPLFNEHMNVNLLAPLVLARLLHAHVPEGQSGVVVNLLDQKLDNLNPDFLSYTLSKAGLDTATTVLGMSLAPKVRVVGVSPGLTLISPLQTDEQFEKAHKVSPLNQSSRPEDISKAVRFLVESPAITGTRLVVDGGQHLVPLARDISFLNEE